jgi:hypothetical protein
MVIRPRSTVGSAFVLAALSPIGLMLDIVGVVLVWRFGLPQSVYRGGVQHLILEQIDEKEAARAARYDRYSQLGLILLIGGFVLQLIGSL